MPSKYNPHLVEGSEVIARVGTQDIPGTIVDHTQHYILVKLTDGTTRRLNPDVLTVVKTPVRNRSVFSDRDQSARRLTRYRVVALRSPDYED